MRIPFWKMHGAANDFLLVDDRGQQFPARDAGWIETLCARRTGVGSDGLILIQPSEQADFRMRFFNPDGHEAEMCGNGARCVARLASDQDIAPASMSFETVAGVIRADILDDRQVRLHMTPPEGWRLHHELHVDGEACTVHVVNTGVPHVVLTVDDLEALDIQRLGPALRYHEDFAPAGANANFISVTGPDSLSVRTYERGVEAETWACGTGITACGLVAARLGWTDKPVRITARSGDVLEVDGDIADDGADKVTLTGPAVYVFQGTLDYPGAAG